jgi:hypothetical protein
LGAPQVVSTGGGVNGAWVQSTDGTAADSAPATTIEAALGVTLPNSTDNDVLDPFEFTGPFAPENGQAIYQTLNLTAPATLTFQYSFVTADVFPFDSAGYVLNGTYYELGRPTQTVNPTTGAYPTSYLPPTPYQTVTLNLNAGSNTLGFVAYNTYEAAYYSVDDTYGSTSITVIDVSAEAVPEPNAVSLLVIAVIGFLSLRKLRSILA